MLVSYLTVEEDRMQTVRRTLAVFLALWLVPPHAIAQVSTTGSHTQAAIDRALATRAAAVEADRDTLRRVLDRSEVKEVAGRMGVDLSRLQSSIGVLDGAELAQVVEQARAVEEGLAGGATTIVITTTTVIIVLLIVILIVLVAD
jgi:hypothetical protein